MPTVMTLIAVSPLNARLKFFFNIYLTDSNLYAYLITIEDVWLRNEQAASAEVDHAQNTVQRYRAMFPIPTATE